MADELKGRRALVTGGSRGIGAAIVRQLVEAGAEVVATARTAPETVPDGVTFVEADVRSRAAAEALFAAAEERLGGVDILVDNAGAGRLYADGVVSIPDEEWQDALDINFLASVRLDSLVVPGMRARGGGVIVHISSAVTLDPPPPFLHYAAAKAALETYSRGLAVELAGDGVRVNAISPGRVASPGADAVRLAAGVPDGAPTAPLGRGGVPDDIANMVSFLVSDRAEWVTGRTFVVDGGGFPRG